MSAAVCKDVTQRFGDLIALDSVSLEVRTGEILGIIGPNGAGKTTLLSRIEGLAKPTAGSIKVLGLNPSADAHALSLRTGVQPQQAALPPRLKVGEAPESLSEIEGVTEVERGHSATASASASRETASRSTTGARTSTARPSRTTAGAEAPKGRFKPVRLAR
ncbi:ATP-binding cassette domain-containing protein [Actinomyces sp. zg328]|uniref:ATP-binding cassette domain-containing protein n=1 Tax=Actinomyces sp. zg328 TaxID=2609287 RepID=UPI001358D5D0|nr:ATP-binding cassette domain-containing protein [Actinomyces sp. zg328]